MNTARLLRPQHSNLHFFEPGNRAIGVWVFTAVALLIVGGYLAWTSYDDYGKTLEQEYRLLETHARFGDAQMAESLRSIDLLLQDVIDDTIFNPELSSGAVQRRQLDKLKQFPEIHFLIVTDDQGQVVSAASLDDPMSVVEVRKFNASQRDYFTGHREAKLEDYYRYQLSRPFKTITGRYTITVSRAIRGKQGKFQGVALVSLSPSYFDSVLQQVLASDAVDAAAIHNSLGDIIYRQPNPSKYIGANIGSGDPFQWYLRSNQHLTRYLGVAPTDNVQRIIVFSKVGDTNLDIGVSRQLDDVMIQWRRKLALNALAFAVVALLSLALAWVSQQRLNERRRNLQDLRNSEYRWKFAIEGSGDGLWDWNIQCDKAFYSTRYKAMLGFTEDEIGTTSDEWTKRIHPEDAAGVFAALQPYMDGKPGSATVEFRMLRKDGRWQWTLGRGMVVERDAEGKPLRMIGTNTDITGRKKAEAELLATKAAAEAASQTKSRFLAAASHDLRQPMQAMSLFQDALARTHLSAEQERISDYLAQSTQSLSEMLDALLDISKLDAGAVEVSSEIIQAVTLMQRIDAEFSPMAAKKSLRFKLCFAFRDVAIITDTKLLMSLLGNLIGNAIKYTQQGGVLVSIRRRGPEALIQVWDTGIGISPEHLDTIYDEYFQIGNPERDRANGLGLGLAIAQRLGSLLGTKLVCRSRPGKGSVFEFRVPLASCGERETPNRIDPPAVGNVANLVGRRVVLVEDDLTVATAMTLTLESFGMTVTRYRTAEEALADSAIAEADIYIADLRLPGLSGVEFLNVVQQRAAKPIRAVVVTGDTAIDRIEMMRSTSWRVLFKPVELSSLLSAIGLQESAH